MMTKMRWFTVIAFLTSSLLLSLGCSSDGSPESGGSGGSAGGTGGSGAVGGEGGTAGAGGTVRMCVNPRDCSDGEPCTQDLCIDRVCAYEPLPDYTVCGSETGISACLDGACQLIWTSCDQAGAQDGDFCRPSPATDPLRLGRCDAGICVVGPCESSFDCWSGEACEVGICDASDGTCSLENAPNGQACIPPAGGQCFDGVCGAGAGGSGGQGGTSGAGGAGGA
jgi:hypothetical protein